VSSTSARDKEIPQQDFDEVERLGSTAQRSSKFWLRLGQRNRWEELDAKSLRVKLPVNHTLLKKRLELREEAKGEEIEVYGT